MYRVFEDVLAGWPVVWKSEGLLEVIVGVVRCCWLEEMTSDPGVLSCDKEAASTRAILLSAML